MSDMYKHIFLTSVYIRYGSMFYSMFPDEYDLAEPIPVFLTAQAKFGLPLQSF